MFRDETAREGLRLLDERIRALETETELQKFELGYRKTQAESMSADFT